MTKVTIAYPHGPAGPEWDWVHSMFMLKEYDHLHGRHLAHAGWLAADGTTHIVMGRNRLVQTFLDDTDSEWLFFFDPDEVCRPDLIERMLESADKHKRPILSALVMAQRTELAQPVSPACVVYGPDGFLHKADVIPATRWWECVPGAGCVMIHRTVLEAMHAEYGHLSMASRYFCYPEYVNAKGEPDTFGEDYAFMLRALKLGFKPVVDTTIEVGHVKKFTLDSSWLRPEQREPSTYVCIPVKDGQEMTRDLIVQLKEQGGYEDVFIYDNGSGKPMKRWLREQKVATVLPADGLTIGEMWNAAFEEAASRSPRFNLAFLNNDIKLGPNFLRTLATALRSDDALVAVCPNYDGRDGEGIERLDGIYAGGNGTGLAGFAFMVKGELHTASNFTFPASWWFTDNYLTMAIDAMGGWYGMVHATTVEHLDGGSKTIGDADAYAKSDKYQADLAEFQRHVVKTLGTEAGAA